MKKYNAIRWRGEVEVIEVWSGDVHIIRKDFRTYAEAFAFVMAEVFSVRMGGYYDGASVQIVISTYKPTYRGRRVNNG